MTKPVGNYRPLVISGGFAYLSGQISREEGGRILTGKAGADLQLEEARQAARSAALQAVNLIKNEIGIDRVEELVRVVGFVQSADDFHGQSDVMNAASDLFIEVLGEKGRHARTAVGVASLPLNAAVELELTLKIK